MVRLPGSAQPMARAHSVATGAGLDRTGRVGYRETLRAR